MISKKADIMEDKLLRIILIAFFIIVMIVVLLIAKDAIASDFKYVLSFF